MSAELVTWLRRVIESDKNHAGLISAGGFVPQRWDTDPPGQVNPERAPYAAGIDAVLVPDEEDRRLRPGLIGFWVEVVAYDRMIGEEPEADGRDTDLPVMIVNNGRREASHVIQHDPLWVVEDCEAKLAILDDYAQTASIKAECERKLRQGERLSDSEGRDYMDSGRELVVLESVVRQLATGYRRRPGYQAEAWKP